MVDFTILPVGDCGWNVCFGNVISPEINAKVYALDHKIAEKKLSGIVETVPSYCTLTVYYRPERLDGEKLRRMLSDMSMQLTAQGQQDKIIVEIPVAYGGEYGPDLAFVAKHAGLSEDEVIRLHSQPDYLIYMMGFQPGFPYLGGLPEALHTPRLTTPRTRIPAGSVGIAGGQTGAYPLESPGGWQLIGRTPVKLYDPTASSPILLDAGQYVRFAPISSDEFESIRKQADAGRYHPVVHREGVQ